MKVFYVNEDIFFSNFKDDSIINYKSSSDNKLVRFCFCSNDEIYVLNCIDIKLIAENIHKLNRLYIYDLKEFSKAFAEQNIILDHTKFIDVRIALSNILNKDLDLDDEEIRNITGTKYRNDLKSFVNKSYDLSIVPYQIFNENLLNKSLIDETVVLNKLKNYIENNYKENEFTKLLHEVSITYSIIETNKINIDINHANYVYSHIKNYYNDYIENSKIANLSYSLTKTSTGRLSSSFHTIQKKYEKCIVSRFDDQGIIVSLDFSNFEIKTLYKIFRIKLLETDFYTYYSKILKKNRTNLKNSIIPFLYGYKNRNKELETIKEIKELKFRILQYIKSIENRKIVCSSGKSISYTSLEDVQDKSINNLCQNEAVCIFLKFVSNFQSNIIRNNLKSKIIATKHDSIILDCFVEEHHLLFDIVKESLNILENEFVLYTLKCNKIGEI